MTAPAWRAEALTIIETEGLNQLFKALTSRGYRVVGPTLRDGAIIYDELTGINDLPAGWTDDQEPGRYQLKRRDDGAFFGHTVGPHSWKRYFHPPQVRLWRARRENGGFQIVEDCTDPPQLAFFGVRACEIAAIVIQDRVFLEGQFKDPHYAARRERAFIVAVNCTQAGNNCFCASMGTGPRTDSGYDLALTEILDGERHYFALETGSSRGATVCADLATREPTEAELVTIEKLALAAAAEQRRALDTSGLKEMLYRNTENPRWDAVAERCLCCANCTMVCPTCFCATVEDTTDLTGDHAERWRRWDSCFTMDFSYIHGGSVRSSPRARYRQWLTHKLASWVDQFGTSGCVGCGRCITWCPACIDITEEVQALRRSETA